MNKANKPDRSPGEEYFLVLLLVSAIAVGGLGSIVMFQSSWNTPHEGTLALYAIAVSVLAGCGLIARAIGRR